ncbi:MFS family permease [Bradyrhizobium sp. LB8.2]|uniref:hypothetical protein n=1 Tax=unclassified Bradyrhizobium TaxID=2631580 RepID=UPI0033910FC4
MRGTVGEYKFAPDEGPMLPGGPFLPKLHPGRRLEYGLAGAFIGIAATFPNSLITVNVPNLPGSLGLDIAEVSWLPAIFVAIMATANLSLAKARIQFGFPAVTAFVLTMNCVLGLTQLIWPDFVIAAAARAANGLTAASLIALSMFYMLQAFPPKHRLWGAISAISLAQLGAPLARLVPLDVLTLDHGRGLHLIEPAVCLLLLATIKLTPLPPSERSKAFEPIDFLTIGLAVPAMLLFCGVLGLGRIYWWTDAPFLGWMLVGCIPFFAGVFVIESHRARPLLRLDWLTSGDMLRLAAVATLVRVALAEQTYGSVGLLTSGGLTNDQLHVLFMLVALAILAGTVVACLTFSKERIGLQVTAAALVIALGAFIDSGANDLTRPPQIYLSQALIGFGTTLFIGPALVYFFFRMIPKGQDHFISFVVLFASTQNVGGLAGSAFLGSYEFSQARRHAASLADHISLADPQVVQRLQSGAGLVSGTLPDPALRSAEGVALLGQRLTAEANILAFDDVFRLVAVLALLTAGFLVYRISYSTWREWRHAQTGHSA